ncbi:MAG: helix-turn-helix transcriptional regulator [Clostridia bacterium]|nr:helix-turn-helix transcriptional regulator [Clostridia bacterium]
MGKSSTKGNKTLYQTARENLGLSREKASELTGIESSRIERIENEKMSKIDTYDVIAMAEAYKEPKICNHYCVNECPIGMKYVPEVKIESLKDITVEMLASLEALDLQKSRFLQIARDGQVDDSELEDFVFIQKELEQISMAVEALQIWSEKMLAEGKIDVAKYRKLMKK